MALDATVRARVDAQLKVAVEEILDELGLTMSQAIVLFLKAVRREKGLPFDVKLESDESK